MKKLFIQFILITSFVMFLAPVLTAQERHQESTDPRQKVDNDRRAEMREKVKRFIMMRLVEYLDLNENQSAKLFPLLRESDKMRGKLTKERTELIHEITKNVEDESVSEKDLEKQKKALEKINEELLKEHNGFLDKSEKILDDRQYLKLMLFEDRLKEDLFKQFRSREFGEKNNKK